MVVTFFAYGFNFGIFKQKNKTLLVNINQQAPTAAQASRNVIRCALSALAVAVLQDIIDGMGNGQIFTCLGLLLLAPIGLNFVIRKKGMAWSVGQKGSANEASANIGAGESSSKVSQPSTTLQSGGDSAVT